MNSIEKLTKIFSEFPGIGPRQARRFVYYLLAAPDFNLDDLARNIKDLRNDVAMCHECRRFYEKKNKNSDLCKICADPNRDESILMIVQRDIDLEAVEKNGSGQAGGFNGVYFVLGGSVPILEKEPDKKIRIKELESRIKEDKKIKEIILGMNWNPEGENTGDYVTKQLKQITDNRNTKITHLGKGLSMGTELEYADSDTLRNALRNRS